MKLLFPFLFLFSILSAQEASLDKAKQLYLEKSYAESLQILEELAADANADSSVFVFMAYNLWAQGKANESIDILYSALKKKPNLPEVYIELVKAYTSSGKLKGASEICDTALEKFPNNQLLKLQKAYLLARYGKTMTALGIVEEIKANAPNDPRPLCSEAQIYSLRGEWEKAELSMKMASSLSPSNPNYKNNLALIYEKMADLSLPKDKSKATEHFKLAVSELEAAIRLKTSPVFEKNLNRIQEKLKN